MASLIKCRKCSGPHVTLKCGKETQDLNTVLENTFIPKIKPIIYEKKIDKRRIVVIKISNLPNDITVPELNELVSEWVKLVVLI